MLNLGTLMHSQNVCKLRTATCVYRHMVNKNHQGLDWIIQSSRHMN